MNYSLKENNPSYCFLIFFIDFTFIYIPCSHNVVHMARSILIDIL